MPDVRLVWLLLYACQLATLAWLRRFYEFKLRKLEVFLLFWLQRTDKGWKKKKKK